MNNPDSKQPDNPTSESKEPQFRFGISTLLVMTVIAGMLAGYFREQGPRGWVVVATTTPLAVVIGLMMGWSLGSTVNRVFWAVVAAIIIQVLTSNVILRSDLDYYAWPVVAAVCGGLLGGQFNHVLVRMLFGSLAAAVCYSLYAGVLIRAWNPDLTIEMMVAVKCGALLAVLIEFCVWLESRYRVPQSLLAFALVLISICGALIAPEIIPGW